ncbi:hypothetical protein CPB84DRAFT_1773367 [Gymnopilus junonius]|uniref:Ubiquitin-like domain-containing protein n=1 Tax=Gymnopilus junonius TaxID=109634 RepID=A0A9P5TPX6_GYMJU|nr:hypothetical protein CPB84DRAFT_1773367 [Gymnopilus junonius]
MPEITIQVVHGDDPFPDPSLSIESSSSVAELKEAIAAWWNIPTDEQLLVYYTQPLQDNNTLETYNIGNDSKVQLVMQIPGLIPIFFNNGSRKTPVRVRQKDTISQLKEYILQKEGTNPDTYTITYNSRSVNDYTTVRELGLKTYDNVYFSAK